MSFFFPFYLNSPLIATNKPQFYMFNNRRFLNIFYTPGISMNSNLGDSSCGNSDGNNLLERKPFPSQDPSTSLFEYLDT